MKTKKLLSLALSSALALSMAAPAFAADTTVSDLAEGAEMEITGTTQIPKIEVIVPATGAVILNPYGMEVTPPGGTASSDQIISAVQAIQNKSQIPIKVGGKITGAAEGVTLVSTDPDDTKKEVKLTFTIAASTDAATAPSGTGIDLTTAAQDLSEVALDEDGKSGGSSYATFQLSGKASKNPTTVWTADDTVGATIAFTFTPNAATS